MHVGIWRGRIAAAALALIVGLFTVVRPAPAATPVPTRTPVPGSVAQVMRNVAYCTVGGVALSMDVYIPQRSGPRPLVIYIHGGGFVSGDKDSSTARVHIRDLNNRGYVAATINYRLAPAFKFPAMLEDVKCAIRHFRARASKYGIDPNRIGLLGHSAGAQLAALAGLADRRAGLEGSGAFLNQSSRVNAVVSLYGYADMTVALPRRQRDQLLKTFATVDGLKRGSPVAYISADDPPFLIMHGDRDQTIPASQSQILYQRLRGAGVPATLYLVANADHGFTPVGGQPVTPTQKERLKYIGDFFDRWLR
ncbi:MAG: alpha/beta hydrolase [Deltaproteobacteria bacterium]|nr:alpha/beta hydrolase [Deltaproteobacteria bacterium]